MAGEKRVLLVEDDSSMCFLVSEYLRDEHDLVLCGMARDGITGLAMARTLDPDLILLDLILPGMSGLSLLHTYRKEGGGAKVIVVTRASGEATSAAAMRAGADFCLIKPVFLQELVSTVRLYCQSGQDEAERLLREMGAEKSSLGRKYAAQAVVQLTGGQVEQLKEVYFQVAADHQTTYSCVEKNIRTLVRALHQSMTPRYRQVTGLAPADRPPTNGAFLFAAARFLAPGATIPL